MNEFWASKWRKSGSDASSPYISFAPVLPVGKINTEMLSRESIASVLVNSENSFAPTEHPHGENKLN